MNIKYAILSLVALMFSSSMYPSAQSSSVFGTSYTESLYYKAEAIYWRAMYNEQSEKLQLTEAQLKQTQNDLELLKKSYRCNQEAKVITSTLDMETFIKLAQARRAQQ